MLSSKGMDCVGCTEKAEYVSKAFESLSMPLVEDNAAKSGSSSSEDAKVEDSSSKESDKPEEKGKVDKIKKEELDDVSFFYNSTPLIYTILIFKINTHMDIRFIVKKLIIHSAFMYAFLHTYTYIHSY